LRTIIEDAREPTRRELLAALATAGREHSDATVHFHATVADRLGLNPTDYKAMSLLERAGPLSAGEIAERTGLATASVTALVDRLERRGFVRRVRDAGDRRRVIVAASPEGVAKAAAYFESPRRSLGRLFAPYTDDELRVVLDFLARSTERLRDETATLAGHEDSRTGFGAHAHNG
jgi:DNA-binding MarR family transcriptional regulator